MRAKAAYHRLALAAQYVIPRACALAYDTHEASLDDGFSLTIYAPRPRRPEAVSTGIIITGVYCI